MLFQKFRLEVGTQAMDLLINVLQTDRYAHVFPEVKMFTVVKLFLKFLKLLVDILGMIPR